MRELIPAAQLRGESDYETELLRSYLRRARDYLQGFAWCTGIREERFGLGMGGVIAVFLMEAEIKGVGHERLWVITGNPPSAYFDHAHADTACEALVEYCRLADEWATAVRRGLMIARTAIAAEPTMSIAKEVKAKVFTLRAIVLPALCPGCSPTDEHALHRRMGDRWRTKGRS